MFESTSSISLNYDQLNDPTQMLINAPLSLFWTIFFIFIGILLIDFIISCICFMRIFKKCYNEPSWKAFVPFYNYYLISKYTFGESYGWIGVAYLILSAATSGHGLIVFAFIVIRLWFFYCVYSRIYNPKDAPIIWIMACIISIIFLPIIAFSKHLKYLGPKAPFFVRREEVDDNKSDQ